MSIYKLERKIPDAPIIASTADNLYIVDKEDDVVEMEKGSFVYHKLLPRRQQAAMLFPRTNDLVIHADDKVFIKSGDGIIRQIASHITPIATFPQGIVCDDRIDGVVVLSFIDNDGQRIWKLPIHASYMRLTLGNALFFCAMDDHLNEAYHLIHKLDITTGVHTVLIDFNKHFGDDPAFNNIAYLEYYFLFSYDQVIVCLINGYKIVGIDAVEGTLLWEISEINDKDGNRLDGFISGPLGGGIYNNNYYVLRGKVLLCIDVINKKLTLLRYLNDHNIQIKGCTIYGNKLFFTAENLVDRKWNVLGVFDIDKEEIVWQTAIDMPAHGFLPAAPAVDEQGIYLNDSENFLHVFKAES